MFPDPGILVLLMLLACGLVLDGLHLQGWIRHGKSRLCRHEIPLSNVPLCGLDLLPLIWLLILVGLPLLFFPRGSAATGEISRPPTGVLLLHFAQMHILPLLMVLAGLKIGRRSFREVFMPGISSRRAIRQGLSYGIAILPPAWMLSFLVTRLLHFFGLEFEPQPVIQWFSDGPIPPVPRITMLLMALAGAPVVEELLFRGILFPLMLRKSHRFTALLASSCLFALVHLHPASFIPLVLLGAALALAYRRSGNILTPMTMHTVFNAASLLLIHATG